MKKRMLSAILAMSMVFGMNSITASAAVTTEIIGDGQGQGELVIGGSGVTAFSAANEDVELPVISVVVPTTATIVLDPFNINNNGQIISPDITVQNNSVVPVTLTFVDAKVSTETNTEENSSATFNILTKAPSATSTAKEAFVNMVITDGINNKPTTKALGNTGTDITIATPMAPKGGIVTYKYTGSTSVNPTIPWAATDVITVSTAFKFVAQTAATYNITKSLVANGMPAENKIADVDKDSTLAEIQAMLPKTAVGDGKIEVPIVWTCETYKNAAAKYTFTAEVVDEEMYIVASGIEALTIEVTTVEVNNGD